MSSMTNMLSCDREAQVQTGRQTFIYAGQAMTQEGGLAGLID